MLNIIRTNAKDLTFNKLVKDLDKFLAVTDGDEHAFYDQFNQLDDIKYALVMYLNEEPIGCGAIKQYGPYSYEVKRMYTAESHRGNGYASILLKNLENWAQELGAKNCILETGVRQASAIRLYQKNGYIQVDNYGQYIDVENSVCFDKVL